MDLMHFRLKVEIWEIPHDHNVSTKAIARCRYSKAGINSSLFLLLQIFPVEMKHYMLRDESRINISLNISEKCDFSLT